MTSIQQLQISGIRSFNPNPAQRQSIFFQKPLTVILGKNGAGKTTIIEALLNACAGIMPPGSGQEKSSFVYDAKIVGESEVKAQIRLIFTGKDGRMVQVIRSFLVTRVRAKAVFTTLDNTVAYQDPTTLQVVSSTYKASQVDRVIPEMLGVSPAVLEHVIFCHQEAANWPLSSPKEVKLIFDEIFAATRYVLALERFREMAKEYRRQLKDQEGSLLALREHREQAQLLQTGIEKKEAMMRDLKEKSTCALPKVGRLQSALAALNGLEQQTELLTREAALLEGRVEEKREVLERCSFPPEFFDYTSSESVRVKEEEVKIRMSQLSAHCQETKLRISELHLQLRQAEGDARQLSFSTQQMEREEYQHRMHCQKLRHVLGPQRYDERFGGPSNVATISEASLLSAVEDAKTTASDHQSDVRSQLAKLSARVEEASQERITLLRRLDAGNKEQEVVEGLVAQLTSRHESLVRQIEAVEVPSPAAVGSLRVECNAAEQQLSLIRTQKDTNGSGEVQVHRLSTELDELTADAKLLGAKIAKLRLFAGDEEKLLRLEEQLRSAIEEAGSCEETLRSDLQTEVKSLSLELPPSTTQSNGWAVLGESVRALQYQLEGQQRSNRSHCSSLQGVITVACERQRCMLEEAAEHKTAMDALHQMLRVGECAALRAVSGEDIVRVYEEMLLAARNNFAECQCEVSQLSALSCCYDRLISMAEVESTCPVCRRALNKEELQTVHTHDSIQKPSAKLVEEAEVNCVNAARALKALEDAGASVQRIRSLNLSVERLEREMRTEKERADQSAAQLTTCEADYSRIERAVAAVTEVSKALERLLDRSEAASELQRQVASLRASVQTSISSVFAEGEPRLPLSALMDAYEATVSHQQAKHDELIALQQVLGVHTADVSGAERVFNERKAALLSAEAARERLEAMQREAANLTDLIAEQKEKHHQVSLQRLEYQAHLSTVNETLNQAMNNRKKCEEEWYSKRDDSQQHCLALASAVELVRQFVSSGGYHRLQEEREKVTRAQQLVIHLRQQLTAAEQECKMAEDAIENCAGMIARLKDFASHVEKQQTLAAEEARLAEVHQRLVALKASPLKGVEEDLLDNAAEMPLSRLREALQERIRFVEKSQAQLDGTAEALTQDIQQLKKDLGVEKYSDIEKRYRFTFVQVQTTKLAIKDIDKYYTALEKAVQSYHQEKIALINRISADLWRQTYRGSDIDAVHIRSEAETSSVATGRRSYNYRVVMKRGTTDVDMRGRCSAGQKVLASIIFRLALSEVFCCDCGILALDEPTTNLDEDNARSLAEALRVLIEQRRSVRHFQLIVITHDEQFVRALGGHSLDRFYFVHKDRDGAFSVIDEKSANQLFA